jgi:[acyl-carrier-protein] S-malonyltransferase
MLSNSNVAVVFPGQGSQSVGMLAQFAKDHSEVQETFIEASQYLNYDLWALIQDGPAEELNKTVHTQPALLVASFAAWKVLQKQESAPPRMLAGHSLGEYTALLCANALSFADAVKLVAARGEYMQEAVPAGVGAMAAIVGLDDEQVAALCQEAKIDNEVLSPANFNSIGQVVIAGNKNSVLRAVELAKSKGAKLAKQIPVSVPSHCDLMLPAAERLAALLKTISISVPSFPVINNVDVMPYVSAQAIREGLTRQLFMPVRWVATIQYFVKSGITSVIECGPGKVLSGFNTRINKDLQLINNVE